MSWPQWPQSSGWSGPGLTPATSAAAGLQTPGTTYTPEQWATMQQQNWQQWVQWQQQYQQWQQQYGEQYQKSLALAGQTATGVHITPVQPPLPTSDPSAVPPLPADTRPPLPPEEPPRNITVTVPFNANIPPPNAPPPPPPQPVQNPSNQNYGSNRFCNTSQPPPSLLKFSVAKPPFIDNQQPRNQNFRSEFTSKRPAEFSTDHDDAKKNRWETQPVEKQEQKQWNVNQPSQKNQSWTGNKSRPNVEELSEAEKNFDKQFEQWEAQFNKWKEQNANHPDKQQYKEYEAKWESWRTQLLDRREQMRKKRLGLLASSTQTVTNKPIGSIIDLPVGIANLPASSINTAQPIKIDLESNTIKNQLQTISPTKNIDKLHEDKPEIKEHVSTTENELSILFSQPPKEQRTNIRQRRISIKSDTENNLADAGFLKSSISSEGGIPGLDLVKDGDFKLPDYKEDEKKENNSKIPNLEAISKGINSILGDAKLLNMLSMVAQNKKIEPVSSSDTENNGSNSNNLAQNNYNNNQTSDSFSKQNFSNDQLEQNQYSREFDQKIQNEGSSHIDTSHNNSLSASNNFKDFPNFTKHSNSFRQNSPNRDSNNANQISSARTNFESFNKASNNFEQSTETNDFGLQNRKSNDLDLQNKNLDNYYPQNRDSNNYGLQNKEQSNFRSPKDYIEGQSNQFDRGPSNFNQNSGSNFYRGGDYYQGSDDFNQSTLFRGHENFNQGPSNRRSGNFNRGSPFRGAGDFNLGLPNRASGGFYQTPPGRGLLNRGPEFNQNPNRRPDFNLSTLNRGQDFSESTTNKGSDFVYGPLKQGQDFNQGPTNKILDFNQGFPNRQQDFNQGPVHRETDFNQDSLSQDQDFNQCPVRIETDFNLGSSNRGQDFIQESSNRKFDFNQSLNKGPDFNLGLSHRGSDFKQGNLNKTLEFNQRLSNRGPVYNQNFQNREADFNHSYQNRRSDFNQSLPNKGLEFNKGLDFGQSSVNRGGDFNQRLLNREQDFNKGQHKRPDVNQESPNKSTDFNQGLSNRSDCNKGDDFNQEHSGSSDNFKLGSLNRNHDWSSSNRNSENLNDSLNRDLAGPQTQNWKPNECDQVDRPLNREQWNLHTQGEGVENQKQNYLNENNTAFRKPDFNDYEQYSEKFENNSDFNTSRSGRWSADNTGGERYQDLSQFQNSRKSNSDTLQKESNDKYWDEALILKPVTVVDYGHKSLNKPETNFMEPVQTFDYGHTSKNVNKRLNENNLLRDIPPRFSKYINSGSRFNRVFAPDPPNISLGNRNDDTFRRKFYDNRRSQEKFERFAPKNNRFFDKKIEIEYEDIEDFEDDPFEEPEFNYSSKERENDPYFNKSINIGEDSRLQKIDEKSSVTLIEDLLIPPGRNLRPPRIVIMLRGPPGSGKTFLAKLIKDKEVEQGGCAPRILSLDDYFMVEQDKEIYDKETGRKTTAKEMLYEYEECMELPYRQSLEKAFKKTITDGFFPFIILDCINDKVKHISDMWSFAKQNGFQVYICQMELDVTACTKRNIHHRSESEIERLIDGWETTPSHYLTLDSTGLIQDGCISEVEMEEVPENDDMEKDEKNNEGHVISKWERMEHSGEKLARLDGTSKPLRPRATMEDYLQLDDDIPEDKPGLKRVRWADLEERRRQDKIRAIGFVVGQTDWDRMMDPTQGGSALIQTKYIERVRRF